MYSVSNQSPSLVDKSLELRALKLMGEIKSTEEGFQPFAQTSKFFAVVKKIESLELRNKIFQTAFLKFSIQLDVQWIALKIAKEVQQKNTYLYNLIEACKKTNNKAIAFQAAEELEVSSYKKDNVIKNISNHFSLGESKRIIKL